LLLAWLEPVFREVSDQILIECVLDFKVWIGKGMDHLVEDGAGFFDGQVSGLEHQGFEEKSCIILFDAQ
jgi:hypothetical protein